MSAVSVNCNYQFWYVFICNASFISGKNVVPIGHGNLFWLVLESHGKVMEIDFPKRVVTLTKSSLTLLADCCKVRGTQ